MASDFRRECKAALARRGMSAKDLAGIVSEQTGRKVDSSYLNKILDGQHKSARVVEIVCRELGLKEPKQ